jgi:predicted alpha/beta superfamily hydrolase
MKCPLSSLVPILLLLINSTYAQQPPMVPDSVQSAKLGERRYLHIYLPKGYISGKAYDVLYILDAADNEDMAAPIATMAAERHLIPGLITVCIPNKWLSDVRISSRERDFEPSQAEGFPISGGADRFLEFLDVELAPYIGQKYGGTGNKLLFGHSLSGLFVLYAMVCQPNVFDFYMASDPSLWWGDGYLYKIAAGRLPKMADKKRFLYLAGRGGEVYAAQGLSQMDKILKERAPKTLGWSSKAYDDEHHGSVTIKTLYDGLKYYYFGYLPRMLEYYPTNGILLPGKPVNVLTYFTFLGYQPGVRYTTDGSEPRPASPRFDWGIAVQPGTKLRVKQFSTTGNYDKEAQGFFSHGALFKSSVLPLAARPGGLRFICFSAAGDSIESGVADTNFNNNVALRPDTAKFSLRFAGYMQIQRTGYYAFLLSTDQTAKLYLDSQLVIDCESNNGSFVLPLQKGFHRIRVEYHHLRGAPGLDLTFVAAAVPGDGGLYKIPVNIPRRFLYAEPRNPNFPQD